VEVSDVANPPLRRMKIAEFTIHRIDLPLVTPYRLSYRTFESFEPILVEVRDADGRIGWGEAHISPGSSSETREGGWAFTCGLAESLVGSDVESAKASVAGELEQSKVAGTGLRSALEMLQRHPLLELKAPLRQRLLSPFNASEPAAIEAEVEQRLSQGFRTFKIKVGTDVDADLARVTRIQAAVAGRATLRIDANRAYDREWGCRFAAALDPTGIELFEQPCAAEDWEANAAVAAVASVPLMLDEPICAINDIERAATIDGVGLCKLKLKRFGGLAMLHDALARVRALGLEWVLGDGLGCEISCWMEACVAASTIRNAGEFNGFLKPRARLFNEPLRCERGELVLPAGYWPEVDRAALQHHTVSCQRFAASQVALGG
jgi:L-alanine-DL-glutamate epimerase-like enolase superfamily enzyme